MSIQDLERAAFVAGYVTGWDDSGGSQWSATGGDEEDALRAWDRYRARFRPRPASPAETAAADLMDQFGSLAPLTWPG